MVIAMPKGTATYADYFATPEGERWELIDGVLYRMIAASIRHQDASTNLTIRVGGYIQSRQLGALYHSSTALLLPGESVVEPDLFFVRAGRPHIFSDRACEGIPDLVAEILSPSNRAHDTARKRELYARHGIPEYWILDPVLETVLALTDPVARGGVGAYLTETLYQPEDTLTTAAIPGLSIPLAAIFAPQM